MRCLYNNARLYNSSPEEHPHDQTRNDRFCAAARQAARNSPICASQRQASGSRKNDVCDRNGWSRTFSPYGSWDRKHPGIATGSQRPSSQSSKLLQWSPVIEYQGLVYLNES